MQFVIRSLGLNLSGFLVFFNHPSEKSRLLKGVNNLLIFCDLGNWNFWYPWFVIRYFFSIHETAIDPPVRPSLRWSRLAYGTRWVCGVIMLSLPTRNDSHTHAWSHTCTQSLRSMMQKINHGVLYSTQVDVCSPDWFWLCRSDITQPKARISGMKN